MEKWGQLRIPAVEGRAFAVFLRASSNQSPNNQIKKGIALVMLAVVRQSFHNYAIMRQMQLKVVVFSSLNEILQFPIALVVVFYPLQKTIYF